MTAFELPEIPGGVVLPTDNRMATFSLHCQARLHLLCPEGDDVMVCICECHKKGTDGAAQGQTY